MVFLPITKDLKMIYPKFVLGRGKKIKEHYECWEENPEKVSKNLLVLEIYGSKDEDDDGKC